MGINSGFKGLMCMCYRFLCGTVPVTTAAATSATGTVCQLVHPVVATKRGREQGRSGETDGRDTVPQVAAAAGNR